jgi:uncharacterized protein YdhG (YjbR/CyaY superfamily)
MKHFANVDEYIEQYPKDIRIKLKSIRQIIKKHAPLADEKIRYGMPSYRQKRMLVYFAAQQKHIGFYFLNEKVLENYKKELSKYSTSRGTIRFPLDKKLPIGLISRIIQFRVKQDLKNQF